MHQELAWTATAPPGPGLHAGAEAASFHPPPAALDRPDPARPGLLARAAAGASTALHAWIGRERGRFAPWLSVAMGSGALAYFALRAEPSLWLAPALLALALLAATALRRSLAPRGLALAGVAAALGFGGAQLASLRALPVESLPSRATILTGTLHGVEILPDGARRITLSGVRLTEDAAPLARRLRVRLRAADGTPLAAGDLVQVRALLRPPPAPSYPGAWDLQRDEFFAGLAGGGTALGPVAVLRHAPPAGLAGWWQGVRDAIAARALAGLPGTAGAIAATLLTGGQTAIPPADRAAFRDAGLAHLLAVAGLHIGIVMGLAMGLTRAGLALSEHAALHWPCKAIAAGTALAAGGLYALLTGAHVPILRSFAMCALVVLGILVGRRALSLRGLALAAAVLILFAPQEIVGVSFQMSFSAVLALVSGYEALRPVLARIRGRGGWRGRTLHHLACLALTSLLAGTASLPYGAYHFGHVQLYYVAANMVAVPIWAMLTMPAGMAALALMPLGLERLALVPMGWGADAALWVGRTVSAWPAATLPVPHMPGWGLAVLSLGLAWLGIWRSRARLGGLVAIGLGLISPALEPPPDILVSADARLIAVRTASGAYAAQRSGAASFTRDAWLAYWAAPGFRPFPARGEGADGAVACTDLACRLRPRPESAAAILLRGERPPEACDAAVLVSPEPARGLCPGLPRVDRFTVWRDGAHAIWLDGEGARILSDRAARGARPWVPPPPVPRGKVSPGLRMAEPDALPAEAE